MKPHVSCLMASSIDGRILPSRWRPRSANASDAFERMHERLGGGSWLVGRVTGQEFAKARAYSDHTGQRFPRSPWIATHGAKAYGIVLDAHGKIAWGRSDIGGDPIVVVLTEKVADSHLAGLRADGVSYVFAGSDALDLHAALETLNRELGIDRLMLEGGGTVNGAFLRAGLIDEINLVVIPAVDGAKGAPSVFDSEAEGDDPATAVRAMMLESTEVLEGGAVWLRYRLDHA